jgi:exodeoxyribonuclease V gamma subunit
MLYLVQSNHLELLFQRLMDIHAGPLADPFVPETIVVQNQGMARWLSQRIAQHSGIAANIDFPLPARFVWQVFAGQLGIPENMDAYERPVMQWRILALLTDPAVEPLFAEAASYLRDDPDGRKAFLLAAKIADLFDRYLVYRPDMLLEWESGRDEGWQAALWRKIAAGGQPHRAELLLRFREKIRTGAIERDALPDRICVFGVNSLAPVYLEILHGISRSTDVHLFHLNPCRHYWADLASESEMARHRRIWRRKNLADVSGYFETGNSLLASWGLAGREFFRQLSGLELSEEEQYQEPAGGSLLASLQRDLLDLVNRADADAEKIVIPGQDRTIQFHSCYSRLREVQVLHDCLLGFFEANPTLRPREILVMAPDIEPYAHAIRAVFDCVGRERYIPWALADRTLLREHPVAAAFYSLFELSGSRCTAPEVTAFLENEAVLRKWGMDEEGLATIRRWIRAGNIRWGFDREHRREHDQEMTELHTWSFGLQRLLLGYFGGAAAPVFHDIAPCGSMSAEESILLGRFVQFLDQLRQYCRKMRGQHTPGQWGEILLEALDVFFEPGNDEEQQLLTALRETVCRFIDQCRAAGFVGAVSPAVARTYFERELSQPAGGRPFLSGRVTFCNMVPMRSVPSRIICLLGMNDTDYPRRQETVSFDRMAENPMPGDRNRRNDDLYLFLEAFLSARDVLSISWIGRDQRDNSLCQPSTPVSELIEYIRRSYRTPSAGEVLPRIAEHPLQPFSRRCFDGSTGWTSYAGEWLPAAGPAGGKAFFSADLAEPEEEWRTVDIGQLQRFWSHPVRFLLRERLGLGLREEDDVLPEQEPFVTAGLDRYRLVAGLLRQRLAGEIREEPFARLQASGELPHGGFGVNAYREMDRAAAEMAARLAPLLTDPGPPLEVDLRMGEFRLTGWLDGMYGEGCVRFRPAAIKGKDMLRLWIEHLAMNAQADPTRRLSSRYVAADVTFVLDPVKNPRSELGRLLDLYWQGLREPLHFFPETSLAWCMAGEVRKDLVAEQCWKGGKWKRGESEDPAYRIGLRGRDPLDRRFRELAAAVYDPLLSGVRK